MSGAQADRGEAVRLAGVVREVSSPAPTTWLLQPEGGPVERREDAGWASVEVDGRAVRVETEGACLVGDAHTSKGAWRELDAAAGGRFGAGRAPFTPARLTITTLAAGDPVEVYGEVVERRFDDDGALREAPTTSLARVRALIVARGDDAAGELTRAIARRYPPARREVTRRPPDPRRGDPGSPLHHPPAPHWIPSAVLALFAIFAGYLGGTRIPYAGVVAVGLAAAALVLRPERDERIYRARDDRDPAGANTLQRVLLPLIYAGALIGIAGVGGRIAYTTVTVTFLAVALVLELAQLGVVARHRLLIATPPWNGEPGARALIAGTVRDPTPVTVGSIAVAIGRQTAYDRGIGSDPDVVKWTRFHADGTFLVDAPAGVVEIDPAELVWASTAIDTPAVPGTDDSVAEVIPAGGKAAAVGWIEASPDGGPARLRSRGTVPAVLLATSALGDPVGLARRMVWHRRITLLGLVVAAAAAGALIAVS